MKTEYLVKADVKKVVSMGTSRRILRITLDVPLEDDTETLSGAQNKLCSMKLNFDQKSVDEVSGQPDLFGENEE